MAAAWSVLMMFSLLAVNRTNTETELKIIFLTYIIIVTAWLNPIALRKAKIAYNFGLSECNRVNAQTMTKGIMTSN